MGLTKMSTKVLVAGDTGGRFAKLMKAVGSAHSKAGPFDACFCVGSFFGPGEESRRELIPYLTGQATVPVPTYFILGAEPDGELPVALPEEGCELCPNLTYLGRRGCREVESCGGLTIAFLSGVHSVVEFPKPRPASAEGDEMALDRFYRETDIQWLRGQCTANSGVDIVLTSEWGTGVDSLLASSPLQPAGNGSGEEQPAQTSPPVGELMAAACPRYHFAGGQGVFHVLAPYRSKDASAADGSAQPATGAVTRFYGLGRCGNTATAERPKQKALQALAIKLRRALQTAEERADAADLYAKATPNPYAFHIQRGDGSGSAAQKQLAYFLPSAVFMGARRRYEFKKGVQGQGYYLSGATEQKAAAASPATSIQKPRVLGAAGPPPPRRLYVSGLAWSATEEELSEAFGRHGALTEVTVVYERADGNDKTTRGGGRDQQRSEKQQNRAIWDKTDADAIKSTRKRSRGFGFVEYASSDDAQRALITMDGMSVDGLTHGNRKLKVKNFVAAPAKQNSEWADVAKRFPGMCGHNDDGEESDEGGDHDSTGFGKVIGKGMAAPAGPARPPGMQPDREPAPKRHRGSIF